jgi:hypothetical protein
MCLRIGLLLKCLNYIDIYLLLLAKRRLLSIMRMIISGSERCVATAVVTDMACILCIDEIESIKKEAALTGSFILCKTCQTMF